MDTYDGEQMKGCNHTHHTSSLTPLLPLDFPLTQPLSHLSVTTASCFFFFSPFIPSPIRPSHSGIHTGAIDLERAVVGDSCRGIQAWLHLSPSITTDKVTNCITTVVLLAPGARSVTAVTSLGLYVLTPRKMTILSGLLVL